MPRISKAPEERRLEFIETAERLFFKHGFDETAVSDIVKELNVAQGTFYCYFKSKEDVLAAVIHRSVSFALERFRAVTNQPCKNESERLSKLVSAMMLSDYSTRTKLAAYLRRENNAGIHQRLNVEVISRVTPMFEEIIRTGNHSGDFKVTYPAEMAPLLVGILIYIFRNQDWFDEPGQHERICKTMEQVLTRSLCAKEGTIHLK